MAKPTIVIKAETDKRFRDNISKAYPQKHGNRTKAAEEALTMWNEWIECRGHKTKADAIAAFDAWEAKWLKDRKSFIEDRE